MTRPEGWTQDLDRFDEGVRRLIETSEAVIRTAQMQEGHGSPWLSRKCGPKGGECLLVGSQLNSANADEGEDRGKELLVWPLLKRKRDEEGTVTFRTLSLIPFRGWEDFEANYGWLWTIFSYEESKTEYGVHLVSGLLGYEEEDDDEYLRLLWLLRIPL